MVLAKDLQSISTMAQKRVAPSAFQTQGTDYLNKIIKDESETWMLVSELLNAEALFFNKKPLSLQMCPKTR